MLLAGSALFFSPIAVDTCSRKQYKMSSIMSSAEIDLAVRTLLEQIQRIAPSNASVLIRGGTDLSRKAIAQKLHALSPRRDAPLLAINCAVVNSDQLESLLFGNEKEAVTNTNLVTNGLITEADGGTLFIDAIEASSGPVQLRLCRLLDRGEDCPAHGMRTLTAHVRLIAGTACDLQALVLTGRFLDDLLYQFGAVTLRIPSTPEQIKRAM